MPANRPRYGSAARTQAGPVPLEDVEEFLGFRVNVSTDIEARRDVGFERRPSSQFLGADLERHARTFDPAARSGRQR